ncbi:hypothetical protein [Galbibacter sp.]|uniref:hypothetical protein n=1 Tax=Galbibacter sp. TaxID=2918471 RepID=UPI003A8E03A0
MNPNFDDKDRKDFLIQMYNQLCSEIDRHIKIIWQIVGVLLSAFAIFALVEKDIISVDIASDILVLVCGLSIAIIIESNYWYNRNLVIIANIERQFLKESDAKEIHYYFTKHRKNNSYIDMMIIQIWFVIILLCVILVYHFSIQVLPYINLDCSNFSPIKATPYLVVLVGSIILFSFHRKRIENYNAFIKNSPGIKIGNSEDFDSNSDHTT